MIKRYNMRKIRWYAVLLFNVPYPRFAFDEDEAEYMKEQQKKADSWREIQKLLLTSDDFCTLPYFI